MLKAVIIGQWSECTIVLGVQVASHRDSEMSIAVMSGDIDCSCRPVGSLLDCLCLKYWGLCSG